MRVKKQSPKTSRRAAPPHASEQAEEKLKALASGEAAPDLEASIPIPAIILIDMFRSLTSAANLLDQARDRISENQEEGVEVAALMDGGISLVDYAHDALRVFAMGLPPIVGQKP